MGDRRRQHDLARVVRTAVALVAIEAGVSDYAALWRQSQIRTGARVLELRAAGHRWPEIADALRLAGVDEARRCAALALSADLASRGAAREARSAAHGGAGGNVAP